MHFEECGGFAGGIPSPRVADDALVELRPHDHIERGIDEEEHGKSDKVRENDSITKIEIK